MTFIWPQMTFESQFLNKGSNILTIDMHIAGVSVVIMCSTFRWPLFDLSWPLISWFLSLAQKMLSIDMHIVEVPVVIKCLTFQWPCFDLKWPLKKLFLNLAQKMLTIDVHNVCLIVLSL